jgi:hypothetical protein
MRNKPSNEPPDPLSGGMWSVTTAGRFSSGRIPCMWNSFLVRVRASTLFKFLIGATVSRSLSEREHDDRNFFRTCDSFVERLDTNGVKRTMNRARVILALLIPALWLVASMECLSDPVSGLKGEQPDSGISASRHGERGSTTSACSVEQSARRWSRRLNVQSGPDGLHGPAVLSQSQFLAPDWRVVPSVCSHLPLGLANCWQFHWRTALEPRAPSSVS